MDETIEAQSLQESNIVNAPSSKPTNSFSRIYIILVLATIASLVIFSQAGFSISDVAKVSIFKHSDESESTEDSTDAVDIDDNSESEYTEETANGDSPFFDPFDNTSPDGPTQTGLTFKLTRTGYTPIIIDDVILKYKFLSDVDSVIEPYVPMNVFIADATGAEYYEFSMCSLDSGECSSGSMSLDGTYTTDVTVSCTPFEIYTISVKEYNIGNNIQQRDTTGTAMCMYVRREIRDLTDSDLDSLMDAMYTMWSVSEEEGVELYGDDYHDSSYLLRFHHFHAAWQDADHIHEGNGFLTQHVKMTNIFEKSVQAVNPAVTIPYWDFTIDESYGLRGYSSEIMTSSMFGSMTIPKDVSYGFTYENDQIIDAAIPDGRWAFLKAEKNKDFEELKTGYGYMRAPWNMNPSPYVSRFSMDLQIGISLPTCTQHYKILEETDMMSFFYDMQYDPHATTHSLTGGIYGCDLLQPLLDAGYITDETNMKKICSKWIFYLKEFYRYNYLVPNDNCTVPDDVQSSECGFYCPDESLTELNQNLNTKLFSNIPETIGEVGQSAWLDFVCLGDGQKIFSGDHLESASPADPSFWVIHPTLERLLHAKLMAGGFVNDTWATDSIDVCDKAMCYNSDSGVLEYDDDCCYGHFEDDRAFDFISGNRSNHIGDSNGEIFSASDPRTREYSMPYIYDEFTWSHCDEDYMGLFASLFSARRLREISK